MRNALWVLLLVPLFAASARADDPVKLDPKHYKPVLENDQVRVLQVHYGPHEKSVMHEHPNAVAIFLTDQTVEFTLLDGSKVESVGKAGEVQWTKAGKHVPENKSDRPLKLILVELKPKPR